MSLFSPLDSLQPFIEDIIDSIDVKTITPSMVSKKLLTVEQYRYCCNPHVVLAEKQQTLGFIISTISEDCVEKFLNCLAKTGKSFKPHNDLLDIIRTQSGKCLLSDPQKVL